MKDEMVGGKEERNEEQQSEVKMNLKGSNGLHVEGVL